MRTFIRLSWLLAAILALCSAAAAHAQFVDASAAGEGVKLTAPFRFQAGDDPAWAAPGFDVSQWKLTPGNKETEQQAGPAGIRDGWYRIRVKLPATEELLALAMGPVECEVYADGELVGTVRKVRPSPESVSLDNVNVIPLPQQLNGRIVTLAVRTAWSFWEKATLFQPQFEPSVAPARLQYAAPEMALNK